MHLETLDTYVVLIVVGPQLFSVEHDMQQPVWH